MPFNRRKPAPTAPYDPVNAPRSYKAPTLLECPTCHENTLTSFEKTKGYQCRNCTAAAEFGVY